MRNLKGDFRGIPRLRFAPLGMTDIFMQSFQSGNEYAPERLRLRVAA